MTPTQLIQHLREENDIDCEFMLVDGRGEIITPRDTPFTAEEMATFMQSAGGTFLAPPPVLSKGGKAKAKRSRKSSSKKRTSKSPKRRHRSSSRSIR